MRTGLRFALVSAVLALLVAGCATAPPKNAADGGERRQPLVFAVALVEVVDNSSLPSGTNFITKRRSRELAGRLATALRERIEAGGGPGTLRVVIERAVLLERPVETRGGITGLFTRETEAFLEGSVTVRLSVLDESGFQRAFARVEVERERPVPEGTSVASRDALARGLIADLLDQVQDSLERSVEDNLAAFLVI